MKKTNKFAALILALVLTLTLALTGCGKKDAAVIKIAVPNDTTNEARALLLLEEKGIIKLKDGAGITATKNDIVENPHNVEIVEAEAAQLPNVKQDVDYAVINSNYAINAGLNPLKDALAIEGSSSAYGNILCVKEGNEKQPKNLALKAALESKDVADYIRSKYDGSVVNGFQLDIARTFQIHLCGDDLVLRDVDVARTDEGKIGVCFAVYCCCYCFVLYCIS